MVDLWVISAYYHWCCCEHACVSFVDVCFDSLGYTYLRNTRSRGNFNLSDHQTGSQQHCRTGIHGCPHSLFSLCCCVLMMAVPVGAGGLSLWSALHFPRSQWHWQLFYCFLAISRPLAKQAPSLDLWRSFSQHRLSLSVFDILLRKATMFYFWRK